MEQNTQIILYSFLFIVVGISQLNPKSRIWLINFQNKIRGTKTEITETTNKIAFYSGIFCLVFGVFALIVGILP